MSAWIEIDGVRSDSLEGVMVTEITPFLLPKKKVARTAMSGRLGAVENGQPIAESAEISFRLTVRGNGRANAMQRARALSAWLSGRKFRSYLEPDKYCIGQIESDVSAAKQHLNLIQLSCRFTAVPPCMYAPTTAFDPSMDTAIPEQITAGNASAAASMAAVGRLPVMAAGGTYAPVLYFRVTGTWQQLSIGQLVITQPFETEDPVYIDCENQVIYTLTGSNKVSVGFSGAFPENDPAGILIGGTGFSADILALCIERW